MRLKKELLLLLVAFLVTNNTFCQKEFKNTFYLTKSYYYHFHKEPINNLKFLDKTSDVLIFLFLKQIEFGFQKKLVNNDNLLFSLGVFEFQSFGRSFKEFNKGEAYLRSFLQFEVDYLKQVRLRKKHHLFIKYGLSFRAGQEVKFLGYYSKLFNTGNEIVEWIEPYFITKDLLDVGISFGVKHQYSFNKRLSVNTDFSYTIYPYLYDTKKLSSYWDSGTPRHVLKLSFGLGFNFGKNQVK